MPEVEPKKILLVDDDPKLADLLREAVAPHDLRCAGNAESVLKMTEEFRPDLFIIDLILPGMRGTTLAIMLRDLPAFRETPIFILSGLIRGTAESQEPVRVLGFPAFAKPFKMEVLQRHVDRHLADPAAAQASLAELLPGRIAGE